MTRIFIVHGKEESPQHSWFPWILREIEKRKFEGYTLAMPAPEFPDIERWVSYLSYIVGNVDEATYFIGQGIGCQAIVEFLDLLPNAFRIGGTIFVDPEIKNNNDIATHVKKSITLQKEGNTSEKFPLLLEELEKIV